MTSTNALFSHMLGILCIFFCTTTVTAWDYRTPVRAVSQSKYSKAHSLGDSYTFDPRDGWQHVNATNLQYKYRRDSFESGNPNYDDTLDFEKRTKESKPKTAASTSSGLGGILQDIFKGLCGLGKPEPVTITWYTGHDLLNPSCWKNGNWAPTDASYVCALTMDGWQDRPKCFKFIEVCHTPDKCVFVRVVDTCAGCAAGSRHVDLTKAAFEQLADPDEGILTVQMRPATEPDSWSEDLWGPKVDNK